MQGTVEGTSATPINMAGHSYFNLGGCDTGGDCLDHELAMPEADAFTELDDTQIPTGRLVSVVECPAMDFRRPKRLGLDLADAPGGMGYDHNFCLRGGDGQGSIACAAELYHPPTGRGLRVHTTAPGLQLYTANYLDGSFPGKDGRLYPKAGGVCLETQAYPDAVNHPSFPSVVYQPGETYRHVIVYEFFTR
jgi:aldose 1-epimerase